MKRWYIALTVQNLFDVIPASDGQGLLARTSVAVWPLLFHSAHEALAYGRKHNVSRDGWLPDGRMVVDWRISCTSSAAAQEAAQP